MPINEGLMSSDSYDWGTPQEFFNKVDQEFGFTLDVCASSWNAKCERFFSIEDDGLNQEWSDVVWMNPPYGKDIAKWMSKAVLAWRGGVTVVCLVPARTDTKWWHDYAMLGEVRFLRGRLKFEREDGPGDAAPFPSALIVYERGK